LQRIRPGRREEIFLSHWQTRLDDFLRLNERSILPDADHVSREQVNAIAEREYERFAARRRTELESKAEADNMKQLEDELKKLPEAKKTNRRKP
jgi:hypothetical protein